MKAYKDRFPQLIEAVRQDHDIQKGIGFGGHDFEHAYAVAHYASFIAEDEETKLLGWVAGICHNTDRIFPGSSDKELVEKLQNYLRFTDLSEAQKMLVIEAVREHPKKNSPEDNPATVALKDADRLDNVGALVCLRSAQLYHNLPPVDYAHLFENPAATFKNPGSIAKDLWYSLEWESWLRLPKAKEIGKPRFAFMRAFLEEIERELKETKLSPYPFSSEK